MAVDQWSTEGINSLFGTLRNTLESGSSIDAYHLIVTFDGILPFAFTGSWAPLWDFDDQEIQRVGTDLPASHITANTITVGQQGHIVLSALRGSVDVIGSIFAQVEAMNFDQAGYAAAELSLEGTGTVFFSPAWIAEMPHDLLARLSRLLVHGATYANGPSPWIGLDGYPDMPKVTSVGLAT